VQTPSTRKGILLAGGSGTRLAPLTRIITKQLLPVFDKPMIYYPLSLLMLAGVRQVAIVSDPDNLPLIRKLLGDGGEFGLELQYLIQERPGGIAEAFIVAADFIARSPLCLVLGDNILYGHDLSTLLREAATRETSTIFGVQVHNPQDYGVVTVDEHGRPVAIDEKPAQPASRIAVPGLYFLDGEAVDFARGAARSGSGELEIVPVLRRYLAGGRLHLEMLGRGFAWIDAGTHASLQEASNFVAMIERRQSQKIACIEEIAFNMGWISADQLRHHAAAYGRSSYGEYLASLLDEPAASPALRIVGTDPAR
jgi:glucose-1-phosphate thymidylyltransferase